MQFARRHLPALFRKKNTFPARSRTGIEQTFARVNDIADGDAPNLLEGIVPCKESRVARKVVE